MPRPGLTWSGFQKNTTIDASTNNVTLTPWLLCGLDSDLRHCSKQQNVMMYPVQLTDVFSDTFRPLIESAINVSTELDEIVAGQPIKGYISYTLLGPIAWTPLRSLIIKIPLNLLIVLRFSTKGILLHETRLILLSWSK